MWVKAASGVLYREVKTRYLSLCGFTRYYDICSWSEFHNGVLPFHSESELNRLVTFEDMPDEYFSLNPKDKSPLDDSSLRYIMRKEETVIKFDADEWYEYVLYDDYRDYGILMMVAAIIIAFGLFIVEAISPELRPIQ